MRAKKKPKGQYRVGYCRPPTNTRFKKNQSGNPRGRPKGTPNFATVLERELNVKVKVGEYSLTKLQKTVQDLVDRSCAGDARARQQLLNAMHVLNDEPGNPVRPTIPLTEHDQRVMDNLLARLRQPGQEGETNAAKAQADPHGERVRDDPAV